MGVRDKTKVGWRVFVPLGLNMGCGTGAHGPVAE